MDKTLTELGARARDLHQQYIRMIVGDRGDREDRVNWLANWSLDAVRLLGELGLQTEEPPF